MNRRRSIASFSALYLTVFIGFGPWTASALPDECLLNCRESRIQCSQGVRSDFRTCRDTCNKSVRTAIADARESCQLDAIEPDACRQRIRTAARAAGEACRPDCRSAHRSDRRSCRAEAQHCGETCRGPIDEACAVQCHEEFQPCSSDLRTCRGGCEQERQAAQQACRNSSNNRAQFRECRKTLHMDARECVVSCHETSSCGETMHECLDHCRID